MLEFLISLWPILQPLVQLVVAVGGPIVVGWLTAKVAALLNVKTEAGKAALETALRDALHASAANAAKLSLGRADKMVIAIDYVKSKNPGAVAKFGLDDAGIADIIATKVK